MSRLIQPRLLRRERFRSRSLSVSIALTLIAFAAAYVAIESVLSLLGRAPLLASPDQLAAAVNEPTTIVLAVAAAVGVSGIVAILVAVTPGRRARHTPGHDRLAVVVDDVVLASALSRHVRGAAGVSSDRVHTTVSRRRARITVTPSSGIPIDRVAVERAAQEITDALALRPRVATSVTISPSGVVGS